MRILFWLIPLTISLFLTSCGGDSNALTATANLTTDEARYLTAVKKIDSGEYQTAIDIIVNQISAVYKEKIEVKESLMGAYAGKCGISITGLIQGLGTFSGSVFSFSLSPFAGTIVDPSACDSAIAVLQSIGSAATRNENQNVYGAILGLAKIGVNLHSTFDQESSGLGNGVVDATWNSCTAAATSTAGKLTDAEVKKIITGMGLIFENITALSSVIGATNAGVSSLDAAKTQCTATAGAVCTVTSETSVILTPAVVRLYRRMIASSVFGFGTCDISSSTVPPSCCPALAYP